MAKSLTKKVVVISKKYKLLLIPYFLISATVVVVYAAFCLQVYNKQGTAEIPEELLQLWMPLALPWIPILIWLRPRIKLLKMKRDGRRSPDYAIMFVATLCMTIPMMESSFYLEEYCGKLTHLYRISDINNHLPTEYYSADTFYIDKQNSGLYYSSYTSGRFNSTLNFEIHIVCPMYDRKYSWYKVDTSLGIIAPPSAATDTGSDKTNNVVFTPPAVVQDTEVTLGYGTIERGDINITPSAWLGVHYYTSMGNLASNAKKKDREHEFYRECVAKFDDSDMNHFTYLRRVSDNDHRDYYRKAAIKSLDTLNVAHAIILEGGYGNFDTRMGHRLLWIFLTYAIATSVFATIVLLVKFDETKLDLFEQKQQLS